MAEDGNAFTQIFSVIESSQEVVVEWSDDAVHVLAVLACVLLRVSRLCACFSCIFVGRWNKCLQQAKTLFAVAPICSMCNTDDPCHLHVCACDASVCFVCSLCTFLGVIFWSRPLWIEAFFSHLLLSCWLSKAGESKQTPRTQQTEAVRPA